MGVIIDSKLNFNIILILPCTLKSQELFKSCKVTSYNAYILSLLKYSPLIWTFTTKTTNKCMQQIQKRALRIILGKFNQTL